MDERFYSAVYAALLGDLEAFTGHLDATPGLAAARSACGHPTLLQFVAVEGGLGRVPDALRAAAALVERGAPLEEPLVAACSVGFLALVDRLLEAGAAVEACAPWTPLEEAVYWGHRALAEHLRDRYGARVPSLRAAAGLDDLEHVGDFLGGDGLAANAGPVRYPWGTLEGDAQDVLDQALAVAAANGCAAAAARLLAAGARADVFPPGIHQGGTALHMAALHGHAGLAHLLLDAGAPARLRDPEHDATPADWARHGGYADLAAALDARAGPDGS